MSLRLRLTLLYSTLLAGILLVLGVAVYFLISSVLRSQMDTMLAEAAAEIIRSASVDARGELQIAPPSAMSDIAGVYVQVRSRDGDLRVNTASILTQDRPLDPDGALAEAPIYGETTVEDMHLRVLSVPLLWGGKEVGLIQVAADLTVLDALDDLLPLLLFALAGLSILLAGAGSWTILGETLSPLETVTETAEQINRADDLSRRIPYRGPADDEIGRLIEAFNQTLERLESLFTSQQRLLADVSHELRTPLTVIKGNVDLMRRLSTLDEESLNTIDQEAGRLTRLVGGLLLLAQAETGQLPLNMQPLELDTLLLEVLQEMRVLAGEKVKIQLTEIDQAPVSGDRDRLKQVLLNLAANAIQYTPSGGEVFLSLKRVGEQARLIVRDTGAGIPAEDLPHIFERFYRADKSRPRSRATGFGLGLSIAHWIVERHGGRIEVESKEGQGTTFCIWLPLAMESLGQV